ncbi:MAG: fibronectin type III domain-containing protein [Acidimicrobiales bacterium]
MSALTITNWPTVLVRFDSTATSQVLTGLSPGTAYWFRVRAVNAIGRSGLSSASALVTPGVTVPASPTGAVAVAGTGEVTVSWTAPASDGGSPLTGYWVTGYVGYWPTVLVRFESTVTSQVIAGLSSGTSYWFRVRAVNAIGRSGLSNPTGLVTPTA